MNDNVLVYLESKGMYFSFESKSIFKDIEIISEMLLFEDIDLFYYTDIDAYDRIYKLSISDEKRLSMFCELRTFVVDDDSVPLSEKLGLIDNLDAGLYGYCLKSESINDAHMLNEINRKFLEDDNNYIDDDIIKENIGFKVKKGFH